MEDKTQLFYNDVDIYEDVDIHKCLIHDRAGGKADNVELIFPDDDKIWDKWKPQKGDTVRIKTGFYDTGKMYVDEIIPKSGTFEINAISIPLNTKEKKTRIWRDVQLFQVANDCASELGLTLKTYYVENYTYKTVSQVNETGLEFLVKICKREGYSVKICDGALILFSEKEMESVTTSAQITPDDVYAGYEFITSNDTAKAVTVSFQPSRGDMIKATAEDPSVDGGAIKINEFMTSQQEAERWSKGYLRNKNKSFKTAYIPMKYFTEVAGGSTISVEGFGSYDGTYFIDHLVLNVMIKKTIIYAHRIIEGGY